MHKNIPGQGRSGILHDILSHSDEHNAAYDNTYYYQDFSFTINASFDYGYEASVNRRLQSSLRKWSRHNHLSIISYNMKVVASAVFGPESEAHRASPEKIILLKERY